MTGRPSLLEQDFAELLRRIEVERLAGQFMRPCFERHDLAADFVALAGERVAVDQDAGALHAPDDFAHRHLDLVVDARQAGFVGDARMQDVHGRAA